MMNARRVFDVPQVKGEHKNPFIISEFLYFLITVKKSI